MKESEFSVFATTTCRRWRQSDDVTGIFESIVASEGIDKVMATRSQCLQKYRL